jgi:hypothetical protein
MSNTLKESLLLYPNNPTFISIIGSNYLHTTFPHFISNLAFYLLIMVFIFSFDLLTNRKMLYVNLPLLFIILPILSSLVNVILFSSLGSNLPGKGFSAIVAGVFGYLAFSTLHFIRDYHDIKFNRKILQLLDLFIIINALIISIIYGFFLPIILLIVLGIGALFYFIDDIKKIISLLRGLKRWNFVIIFISIYLCLFVGVISLFPGSLQKNGSIVNILAHYVGYFFGITVPAIISAYIVEKTYKDKI